MTLHLIKLAVGIADLEQLAALRRRRAGDGPCLIGTRQMPKRAAELLAGGSLYWVIRGLVQARQRILGIAPGDAEGRPRCLLELDHALVPCEPLSHRPFQGWRYLAPEAAPADRNGGADLSPALARELRALGLL